MVLFGYYSRQQRYFCPVRQHHPSPHASISHIFHPSLHLVMQNGEVPTQVQLPFSLSQGSAPTAVAFIQLVYLPYFWTGFSTLLLTFSSPLSPFNSNREAI